MDVAASKTETDPVLWSWGLYPLRPVHPACFVCPLGGESEVWCSLYTVWSWASPFPSLASVVSIAAEGRGSMSCPGSLKGQAGGMERIAPTHPADSSTKLPSKWNRRKHTQDFNSSEYLGGNEHGGPGKGAYQVAKHHG